MDGAHVIEVPLPEGPGPPPDELETLASLLRVIVDLDCGSQAWKTVARRLEDDGWAVRARVGWVVEARRGRDFEQAAAPTRDEAFGQLQSLVQLDAVPGPP